MKCEICGRTIRQGSGYVQLAMLHDPVFCDVRCLRFYLDEHRTEVFGYIEECLATKVADR